MATLPKGFKTQEQYNTFYNKQSVADQAKLNSAGYKVAEVAPTNTKVATPTQKANFVDTTVLEQQQNLTPVQVDTTQDKIISNTPENTIKESQKNDVISTPTEVKPTETKITEPSKVDNSPERLAEIQTNLQNYSANPDFAKNFETQDAFNNYFGRNQRTPEQQKVLDSFYAGYQKQQEKIKTDNARFLTLSTMSDMDLQNINDINDIALIQNDPNLKAKYEQAQKNRQIMEFVYGKDYNKDKTSVVDGLDNIAGNYSQEYATATSELTTTKNAMDKIQDTMDSTYDNLAKQYEGTGETDAFIRAKANKLNSELTNQYNDLARKYNSQLGTVTSLQATEDRQLKEEQSKQNQRAFNLQLYNSVFKPKETEAVAIQTKDFGTSKSPKRMQSLDGGKTRQPISGIGGVGGTGTSGVGGTLATTGGATEFETRFARLMDSINTSNLPLSTALLLPNNAADLAYVKNNLSLAKFQDAKKMGVSFGQMTNPEWEMLKTSVSSLDPYTTKAYTVNEIYRLAPNLKNIGTKQEETTQQPTTSNATLNTIIQKRSGTTQNTPVITPTITKSKTTLQKLGDAIINKFKGLFD